MQVKYVKGIDLSPGEIQEARRRFQELKAKRPGDLCTPIPLASSLLTGHILSGWQAAACEQSFAMCHERLIVCCRC